MSGFDPPPPPPPSQQPPGFGPPAYSPPPPPGGYPPTAYAPITPPPKKGPNKGLLAGIAAAVVAAVVAVIIIASGGDDKKKTEVTLPAATLPVVTVPQITIPDVTLPDVTLPDVTLPEFTVPDITIPTGDIGQDTITAATDGTTYSGPSGWTMRVPDGWNEVDGSEQGAEAAWYTGVAGGNFADNVAVITDTTALDVSLEEYIAAGRDQIASQLDEVTVLDTAIVTTDSGAEYGRIHYTYAYPGVDTPLEAIVTATHSSTQWLIGTYTALQTTFADGVTSVEPYIATLAGS